METKRLPRIMIAAAGSGSGKTTITCGLLQALQDLGFRPSSFKCGPDYIDPMFHTEVLGIPSRNLDLFFNDKETIQYLLGKNASESDLAVLEGVMGYYDGLAGKSVEGSSYAIAAETETPVILVVDGKGMSVSVAAVIKGFLAFREDHGIKGVILNRVSPMLYEDLKTLVEKETGVEVLGYLPVMKDCSLESRHLGLVTAREIGNLREIINRVAEQMKKSVRIDRLLELAGVATEFQWKEPAELQEAKEVFRPWNRPVKIAVAMDPAFCFYYQDNLDLLRELGAEIIPFSPLADQSLPAGISGLILGGGYPELYLDRLSSNHAMLQSIKRAVETGMPCLAECGGFMYLHQSVRDENGVSYQLAGIIEGESFPVHQLNRFGYITVTAKRDNLLGCAGITLKGHEFHYWDSTENGDAYHAQKPLRKTGWDCIVADGNLMAGYPHLHFYSNIKAAAEFVRKARGAESNE